MSVKSDRWIKSKCAEKQLFAQLMKPDGTPMSSMQPIHEKTWENFKDLKERADLLEPGQSMDVSEQSLRIHCVGQTPMITPFFPHSVREAEINGQLKKIPSFGLSSFGYDIRLARNFKMLKTKVGSTDNVSQIATDLYNLGKENQSIPFVAALQKVNCDWVVDMLDMQEDDFEVFEDCDSIIIPPGGFVLAVSEEKICLPRNVSAICMAKSTWARSAITAEVTPLEAGWEGFITIEITNKSSNYVRIHAGIGCMQLMFFEGEQPETSYAERGGKYMNQPQVPVVPVM